MGAGFPSCSASMHWVSPQETIVGTVCERVVDPATTPGRSDQARLAEDLEVVAEQTGCDRHMLLDLADAARGRRQTRQNGPADGVRDSLEHEHRSLHDWRVEVGPHHYNHS